MKTKELNEIKATLRKYKADVVQGCYVLSIPKENVPVAYKLGFAPFCLLTRKGKRNVLQEKD